MKISLRHGHSKTRLYARTFAAQIHAFGALLAGIGAFYLLPLAAQRGTSHLWACSAFLVSGATVFLVSATYHFLHDGFSISSRAQLNFENLDHFGIYLFIAGTYSPLLLNTIAPPWRTPLIIAIWSIAVFGILYTALKHRLPRILQHRVFYTGVYVAMGWMMIVRMNEVFWSLSAIELGLLFGGVISYSLGAVVYITQRPRLFGKTFGYHELWHVSVLLGAMFHFFLILHFYVGTRL